MSPIQQFLIARLVSSPRPEAGGPGIELHGRIIFLTSTWILHGEFAWPCARRCLLSRARWLAGSRLGVSVHPMPHKFLPMERGRANISFAG